MAGAVIYEREVIYASFHEQRRPAVIYGEQGHLCEECHLCEARHVWSHVPGARPVDASTVIYVKCHLSGRGHLCIKA